MAPAIQGGTRTRTLEIEGAFILFVWAPAEVVWC